MDNSGTSNILPIIVSLIALVVSILGYLDNRRNLKINEKNLDIVLKSESNKKNIEKCWSIILETTKDLRNAENFSFIFGLDEAASNVTMNVYEMDQPLNLIIQITRLNTVKYLTPEPEPFEIELNSIKDSKDFRTKVFHYKCEDSKISYNPKCSVQFKADPDIIIFTEFDISEVLSGLAYIENDLNNLKGFEQLIRTFDSDFLEVVAKSCQEILDLIYDIVNKKTYDFKFDKSMKPSEITDTFYDSFNFYEIMQKMEYMSEELKDRSEELGKTLGKQIFNSS